MSLRIDREDLEGSSEWNPDAIRTPANSGAAAESEADRLDAALSALRGGNVGPFASWAGSSRVGASSLIAALANAPNAAVSDDVMPQIPGFRLLRILGRGGVGVVYEAEQLLPRRKVAIKVARARLGASEEARRLFMREAEILARLTHPGIAVVHAVDATDDGRPWFVMELIEGRPLDVALRNRGFQSILRKMADVARAVHHAHLRGVVHLDLKAANILVGADDRPKVLDFGFARLIGIDESASGDGAIAGTIAYMSPEQARGATSAIDARSDVWSLGAILFEVFAKRPLFALPTGDPDVARSIVARGVTPQEIQLDPKTPHDVRWVVQKALATDPEQRFQSALALAEDLERVLDQLPVSCRPSTPWYVFTKFAKRRKGIVAIAALAVVAVTLALGFGLRELSRATHEADKFAALYSVVEESFAGADPDESTDPEIKLRDVFEALAERLRAAPPDDVEVRAVLARLVGNTLRKLGRRESAHAMLTTAVAGFESSRGEVDTETARALHDLAVFMHSEFRYVEAEALHRRSLETRERLLGSTHATTVHSRGDLAELMLCMGRVREADQFARENVDATRQSPNARARAHAFVELARIRIESGQFELAKIPLREAFGVLTDSESEPVEELAHAHLEQARIATAEAQHSEAIAEAEFGVSILASLTGPSSTQVADGLQRLATAHFVAQHWHVAIEHLRRVITIRETRLGPNHPLTWLARSFLADAYYKVGLSRRGRFEFEEIERRATETSGADSLVVAELLTGRIAYEPGPTCALEVAERALAIRRKNLPSTHPRLIDVLFECGAWHLSLGNPGAALPLFQEALKSQRAYFASGGLSAWARLESSARLLHAAGRTKEACDMAEQARSEVGARFEPSHPYVRAMDSLLESVRH